MTALLREPIRESLPADDDLHRCLALHLRERLRPRPDAPGDGAAAREPAAEDLRRFLAAERAAVAGRARWAPAETDGFLAWFEALRADGPGQGDPLFDWLAEEADEDAMRWFLRQELAGEAGFDDLVAMALVRMPARPKMEMARNLWDEFGRGNPSGVHGTLLAATAELLGLTWTVEDAVWEALALGNVMAGMAVERLAYQAVGALGAIELTAPGRVSLVARGMRRLGMPAAARRYYDLHASLDVEHARRWNAEVLHPLVAADPRAAAALAEGALMRLEAGRRCFVRYRLELGLRP